MPSGGVLELHGEVFVGGEGCFWEAGAAASVGEVAYIVFACRVG